jgi:hypothetical protein
VTTIAPVPPIASGAPPTLVPEALFLARIAATLETISRARWIFLVSNLATLVIVGANINAYLSWSRHFPARYVSELERRAATNSPRAVGHEGGASAASTGPVAVESDPATRQVQEFLRASINHRFETLAITLPVIGLRMSISDVGLLASIAMVIVSMWLYYALRHEQHSVGRIIGEVSEPCFDSAGVAIPGKYAITSAVLERARQVGFALSSRFMFVTADREDAVDESTPDDLAMRPPRAAEMASRTLLWSPFWVLVASAAIDFVTLFWPSSLMAGARLWDELQPRQGVEALLRIAVTVVAAIVVFPLVRRAIYFGRSTEFVYRGLTRAIEDATRRRF